MGLPRKRRTIHRFLLLILVAGALLRVLYLTQLVHAPDFDAPVLDPQLNDYWSRALVTGDWSPPPFATDPELRTTPYGRPPGYPWFLASVYRVCGLNYIGPRIVQMILGLCTALLLWRVATRLVAPVAGLVAAACYVIWWGAIFWEGELNSPPLELPLILGLVWCLWAYRQQPSMPLAMAAGVLTGVFALVRPNVLLLLGVTALWLLFPSAASTRIRRRVVHALCAVLLCVAVIAPAVYRNYRVSGEFVLISGYGGVNAYIGNNPSATGHAPPEIPDLLPLTGMNGWNCFNYAQLVHRLGRTLGQPDLGFAGASAYFYERAAHFWRDQPLDALRLTARKALLFWGPAEISDSKVIAAARADSPLLSHLPGFPLLAGPGLLGIALLLAGGGPGEGRRQRRWAGILLVLVILGYFASVLPFFMAGRYRAPVVPLLLVGVGTLGVLIVEHIRTRQVWRAVVLLGGAALSASLMSVPVVAYTPDYARYHLHNGIAHWMAGRTDAAQESFQRALEANSAYAPAYLYTGYLREESGRLEAARDAYARAVESDPTLVLARNNLGHALARLGDTAGAEAEYLAALEIDPFNARVRINLGDLAQSAGDFPRAISFYREAISLEPANLGAHHRLVWALVSTHDMAGAETALKQAIAARPRAPENQVVLGDILRLGGDETGARRAYACALALDEDNAAALSRMAQLGPPAVDGGVTAPPH